MKTHDWYNKPETNSGHYDKKNNRKLFGGNMFFSHSILHILDFRLFFFYWMWNFVVAHASNLDPQLIHSPVKWLILSSVILFHKLWYCNWLYCEPAGFIGTFIIIHQSYELNDESNGSTLPFHPTIREPYKQLPTVPPPLYTQTAAYAFM